MQTFCFADRAESDIRIRSRGKILAFPTMKTFQTLLTVLALSTGFLCQATAGTAAVSSRKATAPPAEEEKNSIDLFSLEETYTASGDFRDPRFGHGDSLYEDFSYSHRWHV